ncbi:MAG: biotin transporter BioY [Firmicutes bacterium]|nr:biotin transporter BioY [Bacillota bacterium]
MPKSAFRTRTLILCALFAALICVGAFIRIPTPLMSFTLQLTVVLLAGVLLGPRVGALSCLVYLVLGLAGLPVFAEGGGIGYVLRPSFGYILAFGLGAWVTGRIARKTPDPSMKRLLFAHFAGMLLIYLVGIVYMFLISHIYLGTDMGVRALLLYGFAFTAPGDAALCVASAFLAKRLLPVLSRMGF